MEPFKRLILSAVILMLLFFLPLYPYEFTLPCPEAPCPEFAATGDAFEWINSRDPWQGLGWLVFLLEVLGAYLITHVLIWGYEKYRDR